MPGRPQHPPAGGGDEAAGVALDGMAEGVVRGQEEPGVAAILHRGGAHGVGHRPGVVDPMHVVGGAGTARQIGGGGGGDQRHLVLVAHNIDQAERDGRSRHVDDRVHPVAVEPGAGDLQAGVDAVLRVRHHHLDADARVVAGEVLHRQAHAGDAAGAGVAGIGAGHVGQNAQADWRGLRTGSQGDVGRGQAGGEGAAGKHGGVP